MFVFRGGQEKGGWQGLIGEEDRRVGLGFTETCSEYMLVNVS